MAHATQASLFRQRMEKTFDALAAKAERIPVNALPDSVERHVQLNRQKLDLSDWDLTQDEKKQLLCMLNDNWAESIEDLEGKLCHYCVPGCCPDPLTTRRKVRDVLQCCLGRLFAVPLLYRWKHFESALAYTLRNVSVHGLLPYVWASCMSDANDAVLPDELLDMDAPDAPPAMRQQVRCGKVLRLLQEPGITAARGRIYELFMVYDLYTY